MRLVLALFFVVIIVVVGVFVYKAMPDKGGSKVDRGEVVIYVAQDRKHALPKIQEFEKETGIKVQAKYGTEADKTVGHVKRLIAEKNNPKCDIHWNNEPMHTVNLAKMGIYQSYFSPKAIDFPSTFKDPDGYWMGFAARARVIIYNTNYPQRVEGLWDLIKPEYRGKIAIANPRAGSTQTHLAALYSVWGREKFLDWIRKLKANDLQILPSNGQTANAVADSLMLFALTDTDDVIDRKEAEGKPCDLIFPDANGQGTLLFPNTLAIVKGAPNLENAKILYDWLLDKEIDFCNSTAGQIPLNKNIAAPTGRYSISSIKALEVDWKKVAAVNDECLKLLAEELIQ